MNRACQVIFRRLISALDLPPAISPSLLHLLARGTELDTDLVQAGQSQT